MGAGLCLWTRAAHFLLLMRHRPALACFQIARLSLTRCLRGQDSGVTDEWLLPLRLYRRAWGLSQCVLI